MNPNPSSLLPDEDGLAGTDEALGRQLDQYLDALARGTPLPTAAPDPELERLQTVVERLHGLAGYLAALDPEPAAPTDAAQPRTDQPLSDITCQYGSAAAPPVGAPERVGKYEVLRPLGDGGQATAYLAFDPDLRRRVVLKLYHAARTPQEQESVLKEGRALARVRSPYVAQCYSAERHDGVPYLVMEYIPGKNLAEVQRSKPVPLDRALALTAQLAEGLAAVHACGLLHRDIKPSNILVGDDGVPRLVDFGLAETLAGEGLSRVSGTLPYMAPEQARGDSDRIDPRSDLFGLGAVLYELLTGVPPHQGTTRQELLEAARDGDVVPPRQRNPKVPANANDLCLRCLAKAPDGRFATATDLAQALRRSRRRGFGLDLAFGLGGFRIRLAIGSAVALLLLIGVLVIPRGWMSRQSTQQVAMQVHYPPEPPPEPRVMALPAPPPEAAPAPPGGVEVRMTQHPRAMSKATTATHPRPGPAALMPRQEVRRNPLDNRELRHDFAVKVIPLAGKVEPDGKLQLARGDTIRLKLEVSRDAYVTVWSLSEDGKVAQVFPAPGHDAIRLRAKETHQLPPAGKPAPMVASYFTAATAKSPGPQYLYVLASTEPLNGRPQDAGVMQKKELEQLLDRVRRRDEPAPPSTKRLELSEAVVPCMIGD
jgi:hypothetical protein